MSDFYQVLKETNVSDLPISSEQAQKLINNKIISGYDLHKKLMAMAVLGETKAFPGFDNTEIESIKKCLDDFKKKKNLLPKKNKNNGTSSVKSTIPTQSPPSKPASKTRAVSSQRTNQVPTASNSQNRENNKAMFHKFEQGNYPINQIQRLNQVDLTNIMLEREKHFATELSKVRLVGEFPISKDLVREIAKDFRTLFQIGIRTDILHMLRIDFPYTFLIFLVGMGIYEYDHEAFWADVYQLLEISQQNDFGPIFEEIINHYGFPRFEKLQNISLRYLMPLLMHGGIPKYCLSDFFENIIIPSLRKPDLVGLQGMELIDEVLSRNSIVSSTYKPVIYFLTYGGQTASDFLSRSRLMVRTWMESKTQFSAQEAGLPGHIVDHFYNFAIENPGLILENRTSSETNNRVHKPELCLDPWGMGVFIRLPQQILGFRENMDVVWKIELDNNQSDILPANIRRINGQQIATEILFRINKISSFYKISLTLGERSFQWNLPGINPQRPVLAFNPEADPAFVMKEIFEQETWLLFPKNYHIACEQDNIFAIEEFPELLGTFHNYKVECWDLTGCKGLNLIDEEKQNIPIPIRFMEKIPQPALLGKPTLIDESKQDKIPLFTGTIPQLFIPIGYFPDQKSRWEIRFEASEENTLGETIIKRWDDIPAAAIKPIDEHGAMVGLDHESLLGKQPFGKHIIHVRGPMGMDADFEFLVISGFTIHGLNRIHLTELEHGSPPVEIITNIRGDDYLELKQPKQNHLIQRKNNLQTCIIFPPNITQHDVVYVHKVSENESLRIPFNLQINRLRWRIVKQNQVDENWSEDPITIPVHTFWEAESPFLMLDLPIQEDENPYLVFRCLDLNGNEIAEPRQLREAQTTKRSKRFWRFDLSFLSDIIRFVKTPVVRVLLEINNLPGYAQTKRVPIMRITKNVDMQINHIFCRTESGQMTLTASWTSDGTYVHRMLYLWPKFRPWEDPIKFSIPDEAVNQCTFSIAEDIPFSSLYFAKLEIEDPWVPNLNTRELFTDPNEDLKECLIHDPYKRLAELKQSPETNHSFYNHLEIYLTRLHLGLSGENDQNLLWCIENQTMADFNSHSVLESHIRDITLKQIFSEQLLKPDLLKILIQWLTQDENHYDYIYNLLNQLPNEDEWSITTCSILLEFPVARIQQKALKKLIKLSPESATKAVIKAWENEWVSISDIMPFLFEEKTRILNTLQQSQSKTHQKLTKYLLDYNPFNGFKEVKLGIWVKTNAGWGIIKHIEDLQNHDEVESFYVDEGFFRLSLDMHVHNYLSAPSYMGSGEMAKVDMKKKTITFLGKGNVFQCPCCDHFLSINRNIVVGHIRSEHGEFSKTPVVVREHKIPLKFYEFDFKNKDTNNHDN
ncbi:MAG: hypothetical protein CL609_15125 [Anaerolineaceae bacterium]|nr:hypothetical protein [Anaerolineaceae bacterium]